MKLRLKINGVACDAEIDDRDLSALVAPRDLNMAQAAAFLKRSRTTLFRWKVPKNKNGRYSVATLEGYLK